MSLNITPKALSEPFSKLERVYYEDTDAGGVVYHSNYLNFMERCRCDWLDSLGFNIATLQQQDDVMFVVRGATLSFDAPARLFDQIRVTAQALHVGKVKLVVEQKIYNGDKLLCSGQVTLAALTGSTFRVTRFPQALRDVLLEDASLNESVASD